MPATPRRTGPLLLTALREALTGGSHHDFTEGSLGRAITLLAIPMVLEMVMESTFAICDIFFVSSLGPEAVAAVGLTEAMMTIFYAVAIGLSMSTTAIVARRIGEKNPAAASAAGAQAIYLGLALSVLFGVPCWLFARDLLAAMGAEASALDDGASYTRIVLGFNVVLLLLFLHNAIFRGAGDAVIAMRSLWLANAINIALDPCLIFGLGPFPELGLAGAAIATTCGRGTGVLYQILMLRRGTGRIRLAGDALRFAPAAMLRLLRISLGGIGQFLITTSSWVVLMRIAARFGSEAVAGYTIAIRLLMFTLMPSWGLGNAAATLVGQNLGARKPERAARAVWVTGLFNMAYLLLVMVVFLTLGPTLIGIFTEDAGVIAIGAESLRVLSYGYVFFGWGMVLTQAFNGAGDTTTPTWINFICFWLLQIPLAVLLADTLGHGISGVFWAVALTKVVLAALAAWAFRRGRWQHRVA